MNEGGGLPGYPNTHEDGGACPQSFALLRDVLQWLCPALTRVPPKFPHRYFPYLPTRPHTSSNPHLTHTNDAPTLKP